MAYAYELSTVLVEGWEIWTTGTSEIPGKNVTFKDGTSGSVLIGPECITLYKTDLEGVYEDEGGAFVDSTTESVERFSLYLDEGLLKEIKEMQAIYQKYEDSFVEDTKK